MIVPMKSQKQLSDMNVTIENNMVSKIDIVIQGHFGNVPSVEVQHSNCCSFGGCNDTASMGLILRAIVEVLELTDDDVTSIYKIKDVPCRIVSSGSGGWGSQCIGFGHFMKDQFILVDDVKKWALREIREAFEGTPKQD